MTFLFSNCCSLMITVLVNFVFNQLLLSLVLLDSNSPDSKAKAQVRSGFTQSSAIQVTLGFVVNFYLPYFGCNLCLQEVINDLNCSRFVHWILANSIFATSRSVNLNFFWKRSQQGNYVWQNYCLSFYQLFYYQIVSYYNINERKYYLLEF